jgi:S-adenosylmethionine hydrolase
MPIITLITDWKKSDYYTGIVKGIISSKCEDTKVIDITHNIETFNIAHAGIVAKNSTKFFPKGTIHIIAVLSEATKESKHIIIKNNEHYYILADNGIAGYMFFDDPDLIIELETIEIQTSFPEATIFAKIASFIACGGDILELGNQKHDIKRLMPSIPAVDKNSITGMVIFNDTYGNAITNISFEEFKRYRNNRNFEIVLSNNNYKIKSISNLYNEVSPGEKLALFNSANLLEIAINQGSVKDLLGLDKGTSIRIKFFD